MKLARAILTLLFTVALAAGSGRAQDLGDTVSAPGVFSYQAPKGWTVKDTAISKYKVCFDRPQSGFAPNINVVLQSYPKSLADYVADNKSQIKSVPMLENVIIVDEKPFQTTNGLAGTRLVITDTVAKTDLEQTFYFFSGAGDGKFVVTASCPVADAAKYAPVFDASVKTFSPK